MLKNLIISLFLILISGCDDDGSSTYENASETTTNDASYSINAATTTIACSNTDAYDTFTITLTDATLTISNCTITRLVWSGSGSSVQIEANTTISTISYSGTSNTLNARQEILDLVTDSSYLTEVPY